MSSPLKKNVAITLFFALFWQFLIAQDAQNITVQNESAINSAELEFSPTFFKDGIVFVSTNTEGMEKMMDDRINKNTMSILRTRRGLDGKLSKPQRFDENVTTRYHEGPVCFTAATDKMYFSRNAVEKGKEKLAKDGELKMDVYVSKFSGNKWEEGTPLSFNSQDADDCHPVVSLDGDKLIFASNREGGFGGMDLYIAYRSGDGWGEPINLGSEINTVGNEVFPFLHADNTLYFASNGLAGQGGLDIFSATFNGTGWSAPTNLGVPFNSAGDDFGFIVDLDKKNGYYSSNGQGGQGQDDIFSFFVENGTLDAQYAVTPITSDERLVVDLVVFDTKSQMIEGAKVRVINLDKSNVIGQDGQGNSITLNQLGDQNTLGGFPEDAVVEGETDADGVFECSLGAGNYLFSVVKDGYSSKQGTRLINKTDTRIEVVLEQLASSNVRVAPTFVTSRTNSAVSGAMVVFTDTKTNEQQVVYTDENGRIDAYLSENSNYKVEMYKNGELISSTFLNTAEGIAQGTQIAVETKQQTLPVGTTIELPNIYYNFNDATLRPDARKDLDMVVALMSQYPDMMVELGSHTDSRGTDQYNIELSQARAESVVNALVSAGISADRLVAKGYGETQLRNNCSDGVRCGETAHARNRRTEIKVISGIDASTEVRYVDGSLGMGRTGTGITMKSASVQARDFVSNANAFYVVSGAFLVESNAESRLYDLMSQGFDGAQIAQFDGSAFYYVCVEKYNDFEDAMARKRSFVEKTGDEAFVKPVHNKPVR